MAKKKGTKKAQGKKKKVSNAPRRPAGPRMQMSGLMSTSMGACAVTNAFCPEAIGARWPDNSFTKSNYWGFQNQLSAVSANAAGSGAQLYTSSLYNTIFVGTVVGDVVTYAGAGVPPVTPPSTSRFRVTSWGLRVTSTLSKMTATGTVNIRFFSQQLYATYATTSLSSTMCDASFDVPISRLIDKDIFLIPMPLGTDARLFRPVDSPSAVISTQENNGWQFIQIGVSGAPVGTIPINAYMYYHFEIIPGDGDATNAFAKAPPRNNPAVQNTNAGVLERVGNFIEGTVQSVDKVVKSKSMQYLLAGAAAYNGNPGPAAMLAIKDVN